MAVMQEEGSSRARLDDIPAITCLISWRVMAVDIGSDICAIFGESEMVEQGILELSTGTRIRGDAERGIGGNRTSNYDSFYRKGRTHGLETGSEPQN